MGAIIGIDLGTTFSAVACLDETGRPVIVHNSDGENITPSVVSFAENLSIHVGEEARRTLFTDANTFGRFKRVMGTQREFIAFGDTYSPTDLSTLVLKKMKDEAERTTGPIDEAVVTIPANFANEAREATLRAAKNAGLNVRYIINEPTAAALYYAHFSGSELTGTYAVYDLGGGTFDISIIKVRGHDVEVISTEGVSQLGGDDFDRKVRDIVSKKYKKKTGRELDADEFTLNDAEEEKKSLSRRDKVTVMVRSKDGRINIEITRDEFNEAISSLIAQAEINCETAMDDVGLGPDNIDSVILVGGSTRIPAIHESVTKIFGKPPVSFANPDEVVALGASLYAAYKGDRTKLNANQKMTIERFKISEVTSKCFGTISVGFNEVRGEQQLVNSILIDRGQKIPCSVTEPFYTIADNQTAVECQVTESASAEKDPRFVRVIWKGELPLPPGRRAGQEVRVTFRYDENQTMKCSFLDVGSNEQVEVDLSLQSLEKAEGVNIEQFIVE